MNITDLATAWLATWVALGTKVLALRSLSLMRFYQFNVCLSLCVCLQRDNVQHSLFWEIAILMGKIALCGSTSLFYMTLKINKHKNLMTLRLPTADDFSWIPWNLSFRYIDCSGQFTPKMKANAEPQFAFIFGVNWLWHWGVTASFGVFFQEIKCNGMTSFMEFMICSFNMYVI